MSARRSDLEQALHGALKTLSFEEAHALHEAVLKWRKTCCRSYAGGGPLLSHLVDAMLTGSARRKPSAAKRKESAVDRHDDQLGKEKLANWVGERLARADERQREELARLDGAGKAGIVSHRLEWADALFQTSAEVEVLDRVLRALAEPNSKATVESIYQYCRREVMNRAQRPSHSTSACSNFVDGCRLVAWAKVLEAAEQMLEYGEAL